MTVLPNVPNRRSPTERAAIRALTRGMACKVGDRGRIPEEVQAAYDRATARRALRSTLRLTPGAQPS